MVTTRLLAPALLACFLSPPAGALDFSQGLVVTPTELQGAEKKAIQTLVEEIEKRTSLRLPVR